MQTIKVKISEVKPNKENPRIIKDDKFKKLVQSIKDFPKMLEIRPIVVNEDMVVLGGNMRLKACKEAGLEEVHIIQASDLTEEQQKEFIIKDNVGFGEWDWEVLQKEYDTMSLQEWGLDIPATITEQDEEKEKKEDEVPDIQEDEEIFVKEWDIFRLGRHVLMCGDSMDEECIKALLSTATGKVHCISDPPYGIAYNPDRHWMIKNDDKILDYTQLAQRYTDGFFCMWTWYQVLDTWMQLVRWTFDKITNLIIWHKGGGGMWDCARTLAQDYEIIIVSNRENEIAWYRWSSTWMWNEEEKQWFIKKASKEELRDILDKVTTGESIWKVWKDDVSSYLHPTQKPIEINCRVLENFTNAGDTVLDLFGGSVSNLIACEKSYRTCHMMELDTKYVQTIIKRFAHYTGSVLDIECLNRDIDIEQKLA